MEKEAEDLHFHWGDILDPDTEQDYEYVRLDLSQDMVFGIVFLHE